jgi:hypothetical protein
LAVAAFAADPAFDRHAANIALLQLKPVQKHLGVTEAQRTKFNKAADGFNATLKLLQKKYEKQDPKTAQPKVQKEMAQAQLKLKDSVLKEMSAVQIKRLREVSLQDVGVAALGDEKVAKKIGLGATVLPKVRDAIRKALTSIAQYRDKEMQKAMKGISDKKPKDKTEAEKLIAEAQRRGTAVEKRIAPTVEKMKRESQTKILAMLTQPQRATWLALLGKPYRP